MSKAGKSRKDSQCDVEKQRAKEEAAAQQKHFAAVRKIKTDATRVAAKIGPLLYELKSLMDDQAFAHVPAFAKAKAKEAAKPLEKLAVEMQAKLAEPSPTELPVSLPEVAELCVSMKSAIVLLRDFVAATRKHMG